MVMRKVLIGPEKQELDLYIAEEKDISIYYKEKEIFVYIRDMYDKEYVFKCGKCFFNEEVKAAIREAYSRFSQYETVIVSEQCDVDSTINGGCLMEPPTRYPFPERIERMNDLLYCGSFYERVGERYGII